MIGAEIQEEAASRRLLIDRLNAFDAGLWVGRPQGFPLAEEMSPASLVQTAAKYGIRGGLVSHWRGKTVAPQEGNRALEQAIAEMAGSPTEFDVYAVMTGLPLHGGEPGPLPGIDPRPAYRIGGVRLFPRTHGYPLTEWTIGPLCRWMGDRRIPLLLWHTEFDWTEVYTLAQSCPDLAIIIESQPRKILYHARALIGLLHACPNVYAEISNLTAPLFDRIVEHLGPQRLIFGSFLPVNDPLVALGLIVDAQVGDNDRTLVAGNNLRRLVGETRS